MERGEVLSRLVELVQLLRGLVGRNPLPPWFELPPANQAQAEVRHLLGQEAYRALVRDRRITLRGSAGGRYTLWAARALRGASAYYPKVFDEQRRIELCVALEPARRSERAWEDEWNGLVRWVQWAEPVFLATACSVPPRNARRAVQTAAVRTSADVMAGLDASVGPAKSRR